MLDRLLLWLSDFRAERRNGLFSCSCYGGFDTYIKRFPKERSTIILLTNHDFKNMSAIGNQLTGILQDQPYKRPKLSTAELLYKTYRMSGIRRRPPV